MLHVGLRRGMKRKATKAGRESTSCEGGTPPDLAAETPTTVLMVLGLAPLGPRRSFAADAAAGDTRWDLGKLRVAKFS